MGGRLRVGIKVLTRRAADNARARAIYDAGVAAGKGFETIERELVQALPDLKNPLTPKNVPHFTVRGEDFPDPELARQIMELDGEDRGDGVVHLYRFPVVFPADAWQSVMPHELVTWTARERRYWSEYAEDGQTRYCKTYEPVPASARAMLAHALAGSSPPPAAADGRRLVGGFPAGSAGSLEVRAYLRDELRAVLAASSRPPARGGDGLAHGARAGGPAACSLDRAAGRPRIVLPRKSAQRLKTGAPSSTGHAAQARGLIARAASS